MSRTLNIGKWSRFLGVLLLLAVSVPGSPVLARQGQNLQSGGGYIYDTRYIELTDLGVNGLTGLAYSPGADALMALHKQNSTSGQSMAMVDREENLVGDSVLNAGPADALNIAFNRKANGLFSFNPAKQELTKTAADSSGKLPPNAGTTTLYNFRGAGVQQSQGMDFDPATGRLFLLDAAGKRLISVAPDAAGSYDGDKASRENRVSRIALKNIGAKQLRGLAFNPNTGNLFTTDPDTKTLYEITQQGDLVSTRDMSSFEYDIQNTSSMVFAPSGDSTDDPATQSLYVADTGINMIAEISITPVALVALPPASPVSLVNTIQAFNWNPPAPDTSGLSYDPFTNNLLVSDSEVEEMNIYQGKNVFRPSLSGNLDPQNTCVTTSYTKEPAGASVNTENGNYYFSDDGKKKIHEVQPGSNGSCDQLIRSIDVTNYGAGDPEGIEYGNNKMFIADGKNAEVYVVDLGSNHILDNNDASFHWDTASLGLRDPEGIGYQPVNGTVMIVSRRDNIILEALPSGQVQRVFNIGFANLVSPAGVGVGPGSDNSSHVDIYVSQRGVDNNTNPNENDGKIFEFNVGDFYGSPPPTTPTPPPTSTPPPTPPPDVIFADGFETIPNPLSAWSSSTTGGGDLSVTSQAAMVGSYGMQTVINDTGPIFVTDNTPNGEPRYRARFYFDPNSMTLVSGDNHFIFIGYSGTKAVVRIQFRFKSPTYQIQAQILNNSSAWTNSGWFNISDAPHPIEIDWQADTGSSNGGLTLWIDGGSPKAALTGIANGNYRIDSVQLGAVNAIDTGTNGTNFFDAFESRRQTQIGP